MNHPDQLRFRKGGGCLALFGLPFLLMGVFMTFMAFKGEVQTDSGEEASPWMVMMVTVPFMAIGAGFMFGRAGVDIDRRSGRVVSWWGLMVPIRSTRDDLSDFTHVSLRRKVIRNKNSTRTVYPVALAREGDDLDCESPGDYTQARNKAEELAKFAGLNLHDSTGAQTVIHEADYLDESVADRARRLGLAIEWPELPAGSSGQYETVGESAVIRLPPPGFQWFYVVMLIPALAFVGFFVFTFLLPFTQNAADMPPGIRLFFYGFMSLFIILPIGGVLIPAFRGSALRETVAASWQGIQVERKGLVGTKKWTIPAEELEELSVNRPRFSSARGQVPPQLGKVIKDLSIARRSGQAPGLRLRSDKDLCTFGAALSDDELDWLEKALTYILVHRP